MELFKLQERQSPNVSRIIAKIREEETNKSKISVKKGTLINKLKEIELNVKNNLGDYRPILLDSNEKWIKYCNNIHENDVVSLDTETSGLSFKDQTEGLAGVCIKSIGQTEAYAPVGHISSITEQPLSNQVSKESIKQGFDIMNKKHCRYVFHNAYYDLIVLKAVLGYFPKVYWDTLVAAAMLNENEPHSLKVLYDKYVMEGKVGVHKFVELFDGIPFNRISPKIGYYYSAHDCLMTEQLYLFQKPYLTVGTEECKVCHLEGVSKVFHTEEIPLIEVLADMKWRGIQIDIDLAYKLKEKYEKLQKEALEKFNEAVSPLEDKIKFYIKQHAGTQLEYPINYNSPVQIKILFYEIINTGVIFEKEPNGTGKHVLDKILASPKYENTQLKKIAGALVDVKKYDKALGTFINKLIDLAESDKNHVVRPDFNSVRTRCVVGDTLILTNNGYFHIKDLINNIKNEEEKESVGVIVNKNGEYERYTHTYKYENRQTLKIKTWYGFELEGTSNHPILISPTDFIKLGDLKVGDKVFIPYNYNKFPTNYIPLNKDIGEHRIYGKSAIMLKTAPDVLNEDVAELLGMYHADGYIKTSNKSYGIVISNHDKNVINHIQYLFKKIFGFTGYVDTSYNKIKHKYHSDICLTGVGASWFEYYITHGARNKKIPKEIYHSPKSVIIAYIRGLSLDSGFWYNNGAPVISISVYSHDDAVFIQSVLLNIGIFSSVSTSRSFVNKGYCGYRVKISDTECIKYLDIVGTIYERNITQSTHPYKKYMTYADCGVYVKIKEITYNTNKTVYDIHVPHTHSFISNGFVSHNTGRLSSSGDFNIQQLPSHMGDIRNMFYAGDNKVLILCDYSRQEVAVCAAVSGDEKMIQAFRDGIDIYSHVASLAFNVPYKDCCEFNDDGTTNKEGKERRSKAKAIVLGILYSKGVKAIGEDLHVTTEKAQEIYDSVMKAFPKMHQWLQDVQNFAKKNGYIDGFYGRRRRLPELLLDDYEFIFGKEYNEASQEFYKEDFINRLSHSKRAEKQQIINYAHKHNITIIDNTGKKAKALREVANSIIQGSSADICKIALNSIYRDEVMRKYDAKLVMSIHDEQGVICDAQYADEVAKRLEYLAIKAANALPFNLTCDVTIEKHWYMGDFN